MIGGGGVQDARAVRARILIGAGAVVAGAALSRLLAVRRRPRPGGSDALGN
jgi:hypothetical protein